MNSLCGASRCRLLFLLDGENKIPGIFHRTLETQLLGCLFVLLPCVAVVSALLTRYDSCTAQAFPQFQRSTVGRWRKLGCRWAAQGQQEGVARHNLQLQGPTGFWVSQRPQNTLCRRRQGIVGWRGEFLYQAWCVAITQCHVCSQPRASFRKPFSALACLIHSFTFQLKATSSQDTEVSSLLFCSYSLVVNDGGGGGSGTLDPEPGREYGHHFPSPLLLQRIRWMK